MLWAGRISDDDGSYWSAVARGRATVAVNLTIGYREVVAWREVIRRLKAAGFIEKRTQGQPHLSVHPVTDKEVCITVHGKDAGRLGNRILRDAGVE